MSSQRLTQTQKMLQKLSPQQILLMKLLQIPTMELSSRIKEEIEENPALEESESFDDIDSDTNSDSDSDTDSDTDTDTDADLESDVDIMIHSQISTITCRTTMTTLLLIN